MVVKSDNSEQLLKSVKSEIEVVKSENWEELTESVNSDEFQGENIDAFQPDEIR